MPGSRTSRRSTPYATSRRSLRQASIRANDDAQHTQPGDRAETGASEGSTGPNQSRQSSSTTPQEERVTLSQFQSLQESVVQMKQMIEQLTVGIGQTRALGMVHTSQPNMASTSDTTEASTNAQDQDTPLASVIDQHVNNLIQGNNVNNLSQSTYTSLDRPIDVKVSDKIRDKIWSGQYVDLTSLLDTQHDDTATFQIVSNAGEPLRLAPHKPSNKITSLSKWTDAFLVYFTIYTRKYPDQVPKLTAYMQLIKRLAIKGGDFLFYDREFRYLRQSGHSGWDVHLDLWLEARDFRGSSNNTQTTNNSKQYNTNNNRNNNNSFRGQSRTPNKSPHPMGYCFRYHTTGHCNNFAACSFRHTCYTPACGGRHPVTACPKRQGGGGPKPSTPVTPKPSAAPSTK